MMNQASAIGSRSYTILHTESSLGWGGQERRIVLEAEAMRERGHRLLFGCDPRGQLWGQGMNRGFPVFPLEFGGLRNPLAVLALRRLLQAEAVEVLNTHSSLDSWVGLAAWLSLGRRLVLVRTRHLSTPVHPNWPTRRLYQAPGAIITTGLVTKKLLEHRLGVPGERIFSIPTGVPLEEFAPRPPDPQMLADLEIPPGSSVIGAVAVLRSWKGHLYLAEAVTRLVQQGLPVFLILVGEGPYRVVIEEKIASLNLQGHVRLVGYQERVADWLALLDVVVLASYAHEGVPQALLQALAMEKAVVATDVGGIPEIITPGETGLLVPPRNPQALALALGELLDNPALRRELGRRGREMVAGQFSREAMAQAVEAVYDWAWSRRSTPH